MAAILSRGRWVTSFIITTVHNYIHMQISAVWQPVGRREIYRKHNNDIIFTDIKQVCYID